ncbi:hypothetical protein K439DRAFT_223551 [Ramaria rubella]|nr:hypothetical protein K439DRAFT_223551 [Ramaria rubella]
MDQIAFFFHLRRCFKCILDQSISREGLPTHFKPRWPTRRHITWSVSAKTVHVIARSDLCALCSPRRSQSKSLVVATKETSWQHLLLPSHLQDQGHQLLLIIVPKVLDFRSVTSRLIEPCTMVAEIPPPLSLTVEAPAASSPFPSPSSSFVPPPMPGAHEFANKPAGRFVRRKKSSGSDERKDDDHEPRLNGIMPALDTHLAYPSSSAVGTPSTPTIPSTAMTPKAQIVSVPEPAPEPETQLAPISAPAPAVSGHNTPTQTLITLPPPPSSPSQIFSNLASLKRTPSGSGSTSKHTSLSSSRPAPPSPSPAPSRRQSAVPSIRSRHRSGLSTASTSSTKFGTLKATPQPTKRKGEIKIRDFAFPAIDPRHKGRGPDAPKIIKKLLKQHGPLDAGSRRQSGMSESSVESEEGGSRRSSGFGNWGAFRWASKLGGAWGFGSAGAGGSSNRSSSTGGYTPNQQDFERNFDDSVDVDLESGGDDGEYSSGYENEGDEGGETEPEELLPGLYRALYDFDPEGTAEMALKEGQLVRVAGRGGGVGWAIAIRPGVETQGEGGEGSWALVPESYLRLVKLDDADPIGEAKKSRDDSAQDPGD